MGAQHSSCESKYVYHKLQTASKNPAEESGIFVSSAEMPAEWPAAQKKMRYATSYGTFLESAAMYEREPCLGRRDWNDETQSLTDYHFISYGMVKEKLFATIEFLNKNVVKLCGETSDTTTGKLKTIGLLAPNCMEWILTELACSALGLTLVPMYPTLGQEAMQHIIEQCELKVIVVHEKLLTNLDACKGFTTKVIVFDKGAKPSSKGPLPSSAIKDGATDENGIKSFKFPKGVLRQLPEGLKLKSSADNVNTICYTSGTTGSLPKGVILREKNIISSVSNCFGSPPLLNNLNKSDAHISYLPLAHIYERCNILGMLMAGARIGFWSQDIEGLMDDIQTLKPTIFTAVPRLLAKIYDKVTAQIRSKALVQYLVQYGLNAKISAHQKQHWLWDNLFTKVRLAIGGNVRLIVSAAAPLDPTMQQELSYMFGCDIHQGYGMTETAGAVTLSCTDVPGCIGGLVYGTEGKLVSWETYKAEEGKGEIWVRGPSVSEGYFKNRKATEEVFSEDGWCRTGDIAQVMDDGRGTLKIIDRRKNLLKLAQGEYVSPERVEQVLAMSKYVEQVAVDGFSHEDKLLAIVVEKKAYTSELGDNPEVRLLQIFADIGAQHGLARFEIPKGIIWATEPFTIENGMLTPTAKLRRPVLRKMYEDDMTIKYADLNPQRSRMSSHEVA